MNDQPNLITDDMVVRCVGPAMTGQQEFIRMQQQQQVVKMHATVADWKLPELPVLRGKFDRVWMDLETSGLRWWDGDRMIGMGLGTPDGVYRYLPCRHEVGPNHSPRALLEWAGAELRDMRIVNIRTKFDVHMLREDGINLESQGNSFGDVAHYAALLDDHRRLFNQEDLAIAFLVAKGIIPMADAKVKTSYGYELDPTRFAKYPAGLVAPRAESDCRIVRLLEEVMWPQLTEQDLHRVREIEDGIIPVVVEMEHNGAPINVELLNTWVEEVKRALDDALWDIKRQTGLTMTSATKHAEVTRLFNLLNIPLPRDPEDPDKVSFADALLKPIEHGTIQRLRFAASLQSLLSKFLLKYQRSVARDGILRYELHQLPYQDDDDGGGGAVSGRFSSAAPSRDEGANIQQVLGVKKQQEGFTGQWLVKKLFHPDRRIHKDAVWVKADASQFQFRLFAHYADSKEIIAAYQADRDWEAIEARGGKFVDYHEVVQGLVREMAHVDLNRTHTKNVNFAQVFGAGVRKMAAQLGVPKDQIPAMDEALESGGPKFLEVVGLSDTYHEMFPSVKPLLRLTSHLAMPGHATGGRKCGWACREFERQGYYHRGNVRTYLGRRARFGPNDRFYSALNRIIQGTEGDVNKKVLIEVHKMRHELGLTMRFTVHDELDTDLHEPGRLKDLKRVLNTQYYDFKVPILWEVASGPSWAEAK